MKLGTLLAAGKSLMRGHVEVSYRANRQVYLPKFGPAKNPFKSETAQPAAETGNPAPVAPPTMPRAARVAPEAAVVTAPNHFPGPAQPVQTPARFKKKEMPWAGKFNPASIFRRVTTKSEEMPLDKTAKIQKPAATQTELSLDSVKVLHNDLSDVDVEVVPMKSRSGNAEPEAPKKSWEFLGERLLRVGAS